MDLYEYRNKNQDPSYIPTHLEEPIESNVVTQEIKKCEYGWKPFRRIYSEGKLYPLWNGLAFELDDILYANENVYGGIRCNNRNYRGKSPTIG